MERSELVATLRAAGCVYAEDEAALLLAAGGDLDELLARRLAGQPLEQVLGWAEFRGLRLLVSPGVFVPRRRTEFLAGQAIAQAGPASTVVDLCCGVGAIAAAVLAEVPGATVFASDLDPAAVRVASRNLPRHAVFCGDLFELFPAWLRGNVDVLVANTPYVPTAEVAFLPAEARLHEPPHTFDGGPDGLALLRRVAQEAGEWLSPDGCVLIELTEAQLPDATAAFRDAGLETTHVHSEEYDATVVAGRRAQAWRPARL